MTILATWTRSERRLLLGSLAILAVALAALGGVARAQTGPATSWNHATGLDRTGGDTVTLGVIQLDPACAGQTVPVTLYDANNDSIRPGNRITIGTATIDQAEAGPNPQYADGTATVPADGRIPVVLHWDGAVTYSGSGTASATPCTPPTTPPPTTAPASSSPPITMPPPSASSTPPGGTLPPRSVPDAATPSYSSTSQPCVASMASSDRDGDGVSDDYTTTSCTTTTDGSTLPATGRDPAPLVTAAVILIGAGLVLYWFGRREP